VVPGVSEHAFDAGSKSERLTFSTDPSSIGRAELIFICVPTPLQDGSPDLRFVEAASSTVAQHVRSGSLVVLESTTYPGTTDDLVRPILEEADIVIIHDPQPANLLRLCTRRKGKWIWRAHIDISRPFRPVWKVLRSMVEPYDASIFSMPQFARPLPHPQFLVPPSIDPLSEKNRDLAPVEIEAVRAEYGLDPSRPLLVQISRFDRFKDPVGVVAAYRMVRKVAPVQLVLAGGGATDDPEGKAVLEDVLEAAGNDPDIHVLLLPPDAHKTINALQRLATIILQKSTREGFGLTVTEGMWKGKPVIGGDVGGIRLQVVNHHTGFLVNTPEGAAHRIRYLLHHQEGIDRMGTTAREFVRENYLLTRHIREYLTLMLVTLRDIKANIVSV